MYTLILIAFISLLFAGIIFDHLLTLKRKYLRIKQQKIAKLLRSINNAQRLLNGRDVFPLTVQSSVVCLQRVVRALTELVRVDSTPNRVDVLTSTKKILSNFQHQPASHTYYYALLPIPNNYSDRIAMLRQSMLLSIVFKTEHALGFMSNEQLNLETEPLNILEARLKAAMKATQARQHAANQSQKEAQLTLDNAVAILEEINCNDLQVTELLISEVARMQQIKLETEPDEEEFDYDFIRERRTAQAKTKERYEDDESSQDNMKDDGLDTMFSSKKRKY